MEFISISAREIDEYVEREPYEIIDLRSLDKYNKGHIKGAINCTFDRLLGLSCKMDKKKIYIFYCERGSTSLLAAKTFAEKDFKAITVVGGINLYRGENWVK